MQGAESDCSEASEAQKCPTGQGLVWLGELLQNGGREPALRETGWKAGIWQCPWAQTQPQHRRVGNQVTPRPGESCPMKAVPGAWEALPGGGQGGTGAPLRRCHFQMPSEGDSLCKLRRETQLLFRSSCSRHTAFCERPRP